MNDEEKAKIIQLGASAPALESIRDIMLMNYEALEHNVAALARGATEVQEALTRVQNDVDEYKEWIDFIDDIIKGNANTKVQRVEA